MEISDGYDSFRYLAGGAHIAGKQIISDELGAVMHRAYRVGVPDIVDIADKNATDRRHVVEGTADSYHYDKKGETIARVSRAGTYPTVFLRRP